MSENTTIVNQQGNPAWPYDAEGYTLVTCHNCGGEGTEHPGGNNDARQWAQSRTCPVCAGTGDIRLIDAERRPDWPLFLAIIREQGGTIKRRMGRPTQRGEAMQVYNVRLDPDTRIWVDANGGTRYIRRLIDEDRERKTE